MRSSTPIQLPSGHRSARRAAWAAAALFAVLALATPVSAAKPEGTGSESGGGNQGSVKVVDVALGDEPTGNDPHVCQFYLEFSAATTGETGTWWIVDWPPTGDGTEIDTGTYEIGDNGTDATEQFDLAAGHFRVEWQGENDTSRKHKTFWVDECGSPDDPTDEPVEEPASEPTDEPVDEPTDEPIDEPVDEPADEPVDEPVDEPTGEVEESILNDTDEQPSEEQAAADPEQDQVPNLGQPIVDVLPDTAMPEPASPAWLIAAGLSGLAASARLHRERPNQRGR